MKIRFAFVLIVAFTLFLAGCGQSTGGGTSSLKRAMIGKWFNVNEYGESVLLLQANGTGQIGSFKGYWHLVEAPDKNGAPTHYLAIDNTTTDEQTLRTLGEALVVVAVNQSTLRLWIPKHGVQYDYQRME